jgi:hypothetical protein
VARHGRALHATNRLRSSSFFMTHSVPTLLHCVHSVSPLGTTHRIRLSRHEAQATEARWRICCFAACLEPLARADTFSCLEMSSGEEPAGVVFLPWRPAITTWSWWRGGQALCGVSGADEGIVGCLKGAEQRATLRKLRLC